MLKGFLKKLMHKGFYPVSWRTDLYELFSGHKQSFRKSKQLNLWLLGKVNKYRQHGCCLFKNSPICDYSISTKSFFIANTIQLLTTQNQVQREARGFLTPYQLSCSFSRICSMHIGVKNLLTEQDTEFEHDFNFWSGSRILNEKQRLEVAWTAQTDIFTVIRKKFLCSSVSCFDR